MVRFKDLLVTAFQEWYRDRAPSMASAIAFFGFLAYTPMIAFIIFTGSQLMGEKTFNEDFLPMVSDFVNPKFVKVLTTLLEGDLHMNQEDLYSLSLIGAIALALGTGEYFGQIKTTLETIWNLRRDEFSMAAFFQRKLKTLIISFMALLIIIAGFLLTYLIGRLLPDNPGTNIAEIIYMLIGRFMSLLTFFFLALFFLTYIPPMQFSWRLAVPGALFAAVLHLIGRLIIRNVLLHSEGDDGNPAENFLLMMFWIFYSAQVFIFSAEFSKVYIAGKLGLDLKNIVPEE